MTPEMSNEVVVRLSKDTVRRLASEIATATTWIGTVEDDGDRGLVRYSSEDGRVVGTVLPDDNTAGSEVPQLFHQSPRPVVRDADSSTGDFDSAHEVSPSGSGSAAGTAESLEETVGEGVGVAGVPSGAASTCTCGANR